VKTFLARSYPSLRGPNLPSVVRISLAWSESPWRSPNLPGVVLANNRFTPSTINLVEAVCYLCWHFPQIFHKGIVIHPSMHLGSGEARSSLRGTARGGRHARGGPDASRCETLPCSAVLQGRVLSGSAALHGRTRRTSTSGRAVRTRKTGSKGAKDFSSCQLSWVILR
jgi:hypothetical protein